VKLHHFGLLSLPLSVSPFRFLPSSKHWSCPSRTPGELPAPGFARPKELGTFTPYCQFAFLTVIVLCWSPRLNFCDLFFPHCRKESGSSFFPYLPLDRSPFFHLFFLSFFFFFIPTFATGFFEVDLFSSLIGLFFRFPLRRLEK